MLVVLLMSASLAVGPTAAPAPAPATTPAVVQELKPGERRVKVICRDEVPTGSRFAKRKCITVDDMERRQELTSWTLREMQRNANIQWGCEQTSPTCK